MTDSLLRRHNSDTADGVAPLAGQAIVDPLPMPLEIAAQCGDRYGGPGIPWFHPLQPPADALHFAPRAARQRGFIPFVLPLQLVPILQHRALVQRLTAIVIVQNLDGRGEQGVRLLPDPGCAIANDPQPHGLP